MRRYVLLLLLAIAVIAGDQWSKQVAYHALQGGAEIPLLPILKFSLVFNQGAAFGLLDNAGGWQRYLFIALATGFSAVLLVWVWRERYRNLFLGIGLALVLGGAIGNLVDRVKSGAVIDFIVVYYQDWYFPAFNVADIAITFGAIVLIIDTLFQPTKP